MSESEIAEVETLLSIGQEIDETEWCPHKPYAKQQAFLNLDCEEAMYGGAAGGGKSDALLMAALQYVDQPGYAALILRTDSQRLNLPGGLIPRSKEWLTNTSATWNGNASRWTFPSGASITFSYLPSPAEMYRYGSSEFQFIAFEELTEFDELSYKFMRSRLRRNETVNAPLRIRAATNPGGKGHMWVKDRFLNEEALEALKNDESGIYWKEGRAFIPAKLRDNPSINFEEYSSTLSHLPPVMRERLLNGDWSIIENALIAPDWLRYYDLRGGDPIRGFQDAILEPLDAANQVIGTTGQHLEIHDIQLRRFITIDTAGTSEEKAKEKKGKPPSWSVIGVWDYWSKYDFLFLRYVWRKRVEYPELKQAAIDTIGFWNPIRVHIENKHFGPVLMSELQREGIACEELIAVDDKVTRAVPLMNRMKEGKLFLPKFNNDWLSPYEAELLSWTGDKEETNDQVDMSSYAAIVCQETGGGIAVKGGAFWKSKPERNWSWR